MSKATILTSIVFALICVGLGLALLWTVMRLNAQSEKEDMLGMELAAAQAETRDLTEQNETLNTALTDKTGELDKASLEITSLTTQVSGLEADKAALTSEKTAVENQVKTLASRVDQSLSRMESLTDEIADVKAENTRLGSSLAETNRALTNAEGRLSTQGTDLAQLRDSEIELQIQLEASQLEVKSLQGQLREKEGELTGLESQIETLNKASESIHGSYGVTEDGIFFLDMPMLDFFPIYDKLWFTSEDIDSSCFVSNPNVRFTGTARVPDIDAISWSHRDGRLQIRSEMCDTQAASFIILIAQGSDSELRLYYWLK